MLRRSFTRRGHDLVLAARDVGRLDALAERSRGQTGRDIEVIGADLTKEADLAALEERVSAPDIVMLVNNAGMSLNGSLLDNGADALERNIALNISAPTRLAASAGKAFAARGSGAIINIASVLAFAPGRPLSAG